MKGDEYSPSRAVHAGFVNGGPCRAAGNRGRIRNAGGRRFFAVLSGLACLLTARAWGVDYYVSPSGDDGNSGTISAPFKTIAKARDVVKTVSGSMTSDIHVYLRGGWHVLSSPLTFDQTCSGQNGYNIIYEAYPGESPVISGGRQITGWSLHDSTQNIWKASAPGLETRQLYVDCVRATRAHSGSGVPGAVKTSYGYWTSDTTMQYWGNKSDIEFVYNGWEVWMGGGHAYWWEWRLGVAGISGNAITMKTSSVFGGWCTDVQNAVSVPSDIENAYELLDAPGEWYLDRAQDTVYYKPLGGQDMGDVTVIAPVLERLVSGTGILGTPIRNIQFKGITFAHATWLWPNGNQGYVAQQVNKIYGADFPGGNVMFKTAHDIRFERCIFKHLGREGLELSAGCQDCTVVGCVFTDISGNAVRIGTVSDPARADTRLRDTGNVVQNCYIHHTPCEYHDGCGIMAGYVSDLLLSHNEIAHMPYSGVSCGWGWGTASYAQNNEFADNHIHDVLGALSDGGCIYTLSSQPGTQWHNNWFAGVPNRDNGGGIYPDEGSANMQVYSNVCSSIGKYWLFIWTSSINNINVHHNWTTTSTLKNRGTSCPVTDTVLISGELGNWPAAAQAIANHAGLESGYQDMKTRACACSLHAFDSVGPTAPSGLSATAIATNRIDLSWSDNSADETGFKVDRRQSGATEWVRIATPGEDTEAYPDTDLPASTKFYYKLKAYNAEGDSAYTAVADATTPVGGAVPAAPSGLTAAAVSSSRIDLAWSDNSGDEAGFQIDRRQSGATEWVQIAAPGPDTESHSDTGLPADTKFYYRVKAHNAYGESAYTAVTNATTLAESDPQTIPTAPAELSATAMAADRIDLSWTDSSDNEDGFKIDRRQSGLTEWVQIAAVASNTVSHSDTGLPASTLFYYKAKAHNGAGDSLYSNTASDTTPAGGGVETDKVAWEGHWRYRLGTTEASAPVPAWCRPAFDDGAWAEGPAPFGYRVAGGWLFGTALGEMYTNCTCLFLRKPFALANPAAVGALSVEVEYDDGFVLWLNGEELARVNMDGAAGDALYTNTLASGYVSDPPELWSNTFTTAGMPALNFTNVLAAQVFNNSLSSGDLILDVRLAAQEGGFLAGPADADDDEMDDDWETVRLGGTNEANGGAAEDLDGDGMPNGEEYVAGTDPNDGTNVFAAAISIVAGEPAVSFVALEATGTGYTGLTRYYTLQEKASASATAWTDVAAQTRVLGQGQTVTHAATHAAGCYRVRAWLE
ncbi:MAG: fibronectin type III domain-containing protein [Kiritimatiellae bacterium]|nr:fibronectin type III domain-containing protein [Kiritimatiellia bacterium]